MAQLFFFRRQALAALLSNHCCFSGLKLRGSGTIRSPDPPGAALLDHLIGPCEERRWDHQAERFRGLEVDDQHLWYIDLFRNQTTRVALPDGRASDNLMHRETLFL